uniref:uncharacterized protein isoform X3 n=1 Tax=Pristiophorus japonicus TaxID=55135 RepID=UPI00398F0EE5
MESAAGNVDSSDPLSTTGEEGEDKEIEGPAEEDAKTVEAKDYALFESLCDTVLSSLALLQSSISELLDFKDQLLNHALPSSVLTHLVITTGRLFRSASDMYTPTTELVRLVRFYATPWEQKKEMLELLYANHERKKHQLGVAVRRLQLLDGHARWVARERQILNWEKLFRKLMTAKTHGRRWKFRVEYLKRKGTLSLESQRFTGSPVLSETRDGQLDSELHDVSRGAESRQSLISREDREADAEESEEEEEEEKEKEDSDLEEAEIPTESFLWEGEDALLKKNTTDGEAQTEGQTEDMGTWTGDPLHHRFLCVTATTFYGPFEQGLSCLLTYQKEHHRIQLIRDPAARQKNKAPKQVKISAGKQDLPVTGSKSGILKASEAAKSEFAKAAVESVLTGTQGAKFEMFMSGGKDDSALLEVLLFRDREGVIAEGEFRLPQDLLMEQKRMSYVEIQLFTPKSTRSPARTVAVLCISLCLEELEELMWKDQSTEAWSLEELVLDATGIDLKETSRDELENCVEKPELRESCTSAMSWASFSIAKSGLVPEEQVQLLIEEHNLQIAQLQELHEKQMWELLESLRSSAADSSLDQTATTDVPERVLRSGNAQSTAGNQSGGTGAKEGKMLNHPARDSRLSQAGPKPPQKSATATQQKMSVSEGLLLKRKLPQDVWERMKVLEENMWRSKQCAIEKLQSETSRNLEKQLAVQKRLHLCSDNRGSDSRSKVDEICFPALFMPMRIGQVFTPKARLYFHPSGSTGFFRLTQAPSVISVPPLGSITRMSVLNLLNPRVTLPMISAVQDKPVSREDETMVNRLTPDPCTMSQTWTGSVGRPEEK